jgi:hypothetical protein
MLAQNFGKRVFYPFLIAFFISLGNANAQQNPPAPAYDAKACRQLYKVFSDTEEKETVEQRKKKILAGRQIIEKCDVPENREIVDYLKRSLPIIDRADENEEIISRFNNSVKDVKNIDAKEAFATGKEILQNSDPDSIDVLLVLASVGFDQAIAKPTVNAYHADAVYYAQLAIEKIGKGVTSKQYGAYGFTYKTKENALAWMNYTIGYITYFNRKNRKEALPYLYKATLYETGAQPNPKNNQAIYQTIGDYYRDEYNRLDEERAELMIKATGKSSEAERKALGDKQKELLARQKKYGERIFDAYARVYHLAGQDKALRDNLYTTLKILYGFIFDGKKDGFDEYLESVINSPMLEPE